MSYQVLARKWRPQSFTEMIGQEPVVRALSNAFDRERLHHAYLFTGTRGVGKTTVARIIAKCLNCERGVGSAPCGECSACTEITAGNFVDLIEVDAASRTGVEDTRAMLENVQYAPTVGRFKLYLLDEVHMFSISSFNALLKTLEEPPEHVKFLLATTAPRKLPATILSRCLQFHLKTVPPDLIAEQLRKVLDGEGVKCEEGALWLLARAADGSVRDALSVTDQAIAYCNHEISEAGVKDMLGVVDQEQALSLVEALASYDAAQMLRCVGQIAEATPDYEALLTEVLSLLHRVSVVQFVADSPDWQFAHQARIREIAGRLPAEDVQLFYQMGQIGRRDMTLAPDARVGLEMALLRMLAFRPAGVPELPQPMPGAEIPKSPSASAPAPAAPVAPVGRADPPPAAPLDGAAAPAPAKKSAAAPAPAPAPAPDPPIAPVAPVAPVAPMGRADPPPAAMLDGAAAPEAAAAPAKKTAATLAAPSATPAPATPAPAELAERIDERIDDATRPPSETANGASPRADKPSAAPARGGAAADASLIERMRERGERGETRLQAWVSSASVRLLCERMDGKPDLGSVRMS